MRRFFRFLLNLLAIAILFAAPTYLASKPDLFKHPTTFILFYICFAGASYIMLWIYANEMALVAALNLYGIKSRIIPLSAAGATPERTTSKRTTLLSAMQAYLISIYGFALAFRFAQIYEGKSFIDPINNMTTATYFSIVTIATVGYGDITPKTDLARILVSLEILFGVAYSVFFFSIIAGFIREFPSTTVTDKTP